MSSKMADEISCNLMELQVLTDTKYRDEQDKTPCLNKTAALGLQFFGKVWREAAGYTHGMVSQVASRVCVQ